MRVGPGLWQGSQDAPRNFSDDQDLERLLLFSPVRVFVPSPEGNVMISAFVCLVSLACFKNRLTDKYKELSTEYVLWHHSQQRTIRKGTVTALRGCGSRVTSVRFARDLSEM